MATAIIGSILAAAAPWLLNKIFPGKTPELKPVSNLNQEQSQLYQQLFGGSSGFGNLMQSGMGNIQGSLQGQSAYEKPLMDMFFQQTIPHLSEQFSGMGAGAQSSSAFQQALGSAGAGLSSNLGMLRQQSQQQGMGNLMQMMQMFMQPTFQHMQMPGSPSLGSQIAPSMGQAIGSMAPQAGGELMDMFKLMFRSGGSNLRKGEMFNPQYGYRPAG